MRDLESLWHLAKFGIWHWHLEFGIRRPGMKERLGTVIGQLAPSEASFEGLKRPPWLGKQCSGLCDCRQLQGAHQMLVERRFGHA